MIPIVVRIAGYGVPPAIAIVVGLWLLTGFFDEKPLSMDAAAPAGPITAQATANAPPAGFVPEAGRRTSEAELDAALSGALSRSGDVRSRAVVSRYGVLVAVSAKLPDDANGFGDYVNLRLTVRPAQDGLDISRMAVGSYEIPRKWIKPVLRRSMDWLPGADEAARILANIRSIDPDGKTVTLAPDQPAAAPAG